MRSQHTASHVAWSVESVVGDFRLASRERKKKYDAIPTILIYSCIALVHHTFCCKPHGSIWRCGKIGIQSLTTCIRHRTYTCCSNRPQKFLFAFFYCHIFLFVPKNQVIDFEIFKEKEKKQKSKRKNQNLSAILFKESEQFHSNERKKERVVVGIRLPIFKASQSAWQQLSWKLKKKKKQSQLKREKKGTVKKMALASLASPFQRVPGTFKFGDYTYEWRSLLETPCYGFNGPNACLDPTCKHDGGARFKKEQSKGQQFKQKSSTSKFLLKFNVRAISGDSDSKSSSGQEHMVYSGVNG